MLSEPGGNLVANMTDRKPCQAKITVLAVRGGFLSHFFHKRVLAVQEGFLCHFFQAAQFEVSESNQELVHRFSQRMKWRSWS